LNSFKKELKTINARLFIEVGGMKYGDLSFLPARSRKKTGGICVKPSFNPVHFLVKIPGRVWGKSII
jgi:hypothetical protein